MSNIAFDASAPDQFNPRVAACVGPERSNSVGNRQAECANLTNAIAPHRLFDSIEPSKSRGWQLPAAIAAVLLAILAAISGSWPWGSPAETPQRAANLAPAHLVSNASEGRLSDLSLSTPSTHRIAAIPIQDIRVGMRVPAHNPQLSDEDRARNKTEVDPNTWRKFSLELEKENGGGRLEVTLLRPASWLVDEIDKTEQLFLAGIEQEIANHLPSDQNQSSRIDGLFDMVDTLGYSLSGNELVDDCLNLFGQMDRSLFGNWSDPLSIATQYTVNQLSSNAVSTEFERINHEASVAGVQSGEGVGSTVYMTMPELGAVGLATVTANDPCPAISAGPGEVVTATFRHESAQVLDLGFQPAEFQTSNSKLPTSPASGLKLGVTSAHPFWSVDREDFIPAGKLRLFERLIAIDGQEFRLTSVTPRAGPESVYNFEVANEHVYYVGEDGLLVHNLYVYTVLDDAGKAVYIGIGTASRKASAMARVAAKLGKTKGQLEAAGYTLKATGNISKNAARGLEKRLIQKAIASGQKHTAHGTVDGSFVYNGTQIMNKNLSYATSRVGKKGSDNKYEAAGKKAWDLVKD